MAASVKISPGSEPYMHFDRLRVRSYTTEEVEKLSVLQITQIEPYDDIGHPIKDGLCDPRLGPVQLNDLCETCHQQGVYCPGHMGHIKLDVPVFNPLFYRFTYSLMKGTCVNCHRLTCQSKILSSKLLLTQLRALSMGMLSVAQDLKALEEKLPDGATMQVDEWNGSFLSDDMKAITEIDQVFDGLCSENNGAIGFIRPTKNTLELKTSLIRDFCRSHLFKHVEKCHFCMRKNATVCNDNDRCVLLNFANRAPARQAKQLPKLKSARTYEGLGNGMEEEVNNDEKDDVKIGLTTEEHEFDLLKDTPEVALRKQLLSIESGFCTKLAWRAVEVREHFRLLWKNDGVLLKKLFPLFELQDSGVCPLDVLFCETVLVPPIKFRPIKFFKGSEFQHPQTVSLKRLLEATETFRAIRVALAGSNDAALLDLIATRVPGKTMEAKLHNAYLALQQRMNAIFDQDLDRLQNSKDSIPGLKQILEKKQGLFRMNMMGKRVNYACRSVITPDPYLDVDEIGIPEIFAKKLTFSEPVNAFNVAKLRKAIRSGPDVYPGANFVQKPEGYKQVLLDGKPNERFALAKRLQSADTSSLLPPVQVLRHLKRGDMMLMNRQPSLHKPSLMGHRTRIIKGQKAMRLNYAPCKAYNADFDGDEMNGHFVQDCVAQTEVADIANVGSNFLVPKDGTPLLGLIQDHVISGVKLTLRGRFFNKEDFMHLLFSAFAETDQRLYLPPPAMMKPKVLWSGKQVISAILLNCIPKGKPLMNLCSKAKTPLSCWKVAGKVAPSLSMSESEVVFREAELLVGVLDKQHYGSTQYGLLHCCWELYGHKCCTRIMSCLSRLFTTHLQFHGFTLGVADILVRRCEDKKRKSLVKELRKSGDDVVKECFSLPPDATQEAIRGAMANAYFNPRHDQHHVKQLDFKMKERLNKYSEQITNVCVPLGLVRQFPNNALQTMILSGAKGTMVNSMQISCGLGQIELEGQRPPLTAAGRTLPSFRAFDTSPRAGGFVDQRFLTGLNPQELFFHTMAGREGLIDTAVKTSRSGYLQRCIVKHLEGLVVHYDSTVRDHDNSVIQFRYGEDGMDVCKCTFMNTKQFDFISDNLAAVRSSVVPSFIDDCDWSSLKSEKAYKKIKKWRRRNNFGTKMYKSGFLEFSKKLIGVSKEKIVSSWFALSNEERKAFGKLAGGRCPDMVDEKFNPTSTLGALPEKMLDDLHEFAKQKCLKDVNFSYNGFRDTLFWKGLRSRADPGENVGLLAAQSIGEPSTQMTLNTFHFAGRGEMNVTLGIPRLREILMTSGDHIKTPSAEIRVKPGTSQERIDNIMQEFDRVLLKQVIKRTTIAAHLNLEQSSSFRSYELGIEVLRSKLREPNVRHLTRLYILTEIERRFVKTLAKVIQERYREMQNYQAVQHKKLKLGNLSAGIGTEEGDDDAVKNKASSQDDISSDEEADVGKDADAEEVRLNRRHLDDAADYEGEDDEKEDITLERRFVDEIDDALVDSEAENMDEIEAVNEELENETSSSSEPLSKAAQTRVQNVLSSSSIVSNYTFDAKHNRWCVITFKLPLSTKARLDVASLVESVLETFIVYETPNVEKCIQREETRNGEVYQVLATQGINIEAFYRHSDALDVNSLYFNDLNLILKHYGIEACMQALVKEIVRVFTPYGIDVSRRHLTLTADYMTFTGRIQPFSRGAMGSGASPLQKMTFETTISFMRDSIVNGETDFLVSPSARIVVGGLQRGGTGAFDILTPSSYFLGRRIKEEE